MYDLLFPCYPMAQEIGKISAFLNISNFCFVLGENQTQDLTPAVPNFCFEF
jgi:hypothetical protein